MARSKRMGIREILSTRQVVGVRGSWHICVGSFLPASIRNPQRQSISSLDVFGERDGSKGFVLGVYPQFTW